MYSVCKVGCIQPIKVDTHSLSGCRLCWAHECRWGFSTSRHRVGSAILFGSTFGTVNTVKVFEYQVYFLLLFLYFFLLYKTDAPLATDRINRWFALLDDQSYWTRHLFPRTTFSGNRWFRPERLAPSQKH